MNFDARSIGAIWNENIIVAYSIIKAGHTIPYTIVICACFDFGADIDCSFHIVHIVHIIPQF